MFVNTRVVWIAFQSHAGSIEAPDWEMLTQFIIGFNPTLVRLRHGAIQLVRAEEA